MASTYPPTPNSSSSCTNSLVTVPRAPVTIGLTVIYMCHSFFSSLARSRYLSMFLFAFFNFTLWSTGAAKSTIQQVLFFLLIISRFGHLAQNRWSVCISKSQRSLCVSVMWSTTERREIRNFYYPSVFELTGRQRLTIKRGMRNVDQIRPAVEGRKECRSIPCGRSNKSRSEWKPTDVCTLWPEGRRKRLNDWLES